MHDISEPRPLAPIPLRAANRPALLLPLTKLSDSEYKLELDPAFAVADAATDANEMDAEATVPEAATVANGGWYTPPAAAVLIRKERRWS